MTTIWNVWRIAGWGLLVALLALPAVAMRFSAEVDWTALDFGTMAVLLGALGLGGEMIVRRAGDGWYRAAMAVAALTLFLLIWVNLAVGIIGSEHDDANLLFAGVLVVAIGAACIVKFEAAGMAAAMLATAAVQSLAAAIALAARLGADGPAWPDHMIGATALFDGLWLVAAILFGRAAR